MEIDYDTKVQLIEELQITLRAKKDGSGKNLIVPECPYCGHGGGKFGIYIGPPTGRKQPFMAHCFSCGHSTKDINTLLRDVGRPDLVVKDSFEFDKTPLDSINFIDEVDELDTDLTEITLPEYYKRTYCHAYLKKRGFVGRDYSYFEVGTTRGYNFKFNDYVIFPIKEEDIPVGYVSRHIMGKKEIDEYNAKASQLGKYKIMRYRNSTENDFVKLLYNYDSVIAGETDTVIIVEGIFDAIALTRKLNLYDNHQIAVVATFGKKISDVQMYKLQSKGVDTVVIGYDGDASKAIIKTANQLGEYFDRVLIADILDEKKDFDDMDFWEIFDIFAGELKTVSEYQLTNFRM